MKEYMNLLRKCSKIRHMMSQKHNITKKVKIRWAELKKKSLKPNKIISEIQVILEGPRSRRRHCRNESKTWRMGLRKSSQIKWRRTRRLERSQMYSTRNKRTEEKEKKRKA